MILLVVRSAWMIWLSCNLATIRPTSCAMMGCASRCCLSGCPFASSRRSVVPSTVRTPGTLIPAAFAFSSSRASCRVREVRNCTSNAGWRYVFFGRILRIPSEHRVMMASAPLPTCVPISTPDVTLSCAFSCVMVVVVSNSFLNQRDFHRHTLCLNWQSPRSGAIDDRTASTQGLYS